MQENNRTILSTRPLDDTLVKEAADNGIQIDCISFIETEPIKNKSVEERIHHFASKNAVVVFTSMNAVDAVTDYLTTKPKWKIYCIGQATKQLIINSFGADSIKGTADDASKLADVIIENKENELVFFCGDQRRDELPKKLREHQIALEELVVYKTMPTQQKLDRHYDGILIYSPSAVHSFFSVKQTIPTTIFFAIGETTAGAIREYINNEIVVAEKPGKEALVQQAIRYFNTTQPIRH